MQVETYHPLSGLLEAPSHIVRPAPPDFLKEPGSLPETMRRKMAEDAAKKQTRKQWAERFLTGRAAYGGLTLPYRYFVPETAPGEKYPLVVFLHGGGECGNDNEAQLLAYDGALIWVMDQAAGGEKCFVLAMQCPEETGYGWAQRHLLVCAAAVKQLVESQMVDEDRIYLTGMSMGGGGCYRFAAMYPELFAAVAPICPAFTDDHFRPVPEAFEEMAEVFSKLPLWMFHAADDPVIPVAVSRMMAEALERRGRRRNHDFFYTEYPAEYQYGHGSWEPAYAWPIFRAWLFRQTKKPEPAFGPPPGAPDGDWFQTMMEKAERERAGRRAHLDRFRPLTFQTPDVTMQYRLFVPEAIRAQEPCPLIVCLHGIGECGDDNEAPLTASFMAWDWVTPQDRGSDGPCLVLVPQSPLPTPNGIWEIPYLRIVARIIDEICAQYPVDETRVYLTGLSLGGYGAWNLNRLYPNRFAAVVTCCPACLKGSMMHSSIDEAGLEACAPALIQKPFWLFHAEDDGAVPVEITRRMAELARASGRAEGKDFFVTIYPSELRLGHGSWEKAFSEPELHRWLFAQRLA